MRRKEKLIDLSVVDPTETIMRRREIPRSSKVPFSLRLHPDVIDWLKSKGKGHTTLINDILTNLMEKEQGQQ